MGDVRTGAGGGAAWLLRFALAFLVLNTLLTFENAAPGLGVKLAPRLSFEACLFVGGLVAWVAWRGRLGRLAAWLWAALFLVLAVTRFADVTIAAVFGRPVNVYWDGRHGWDALQLLLSSVPGWHVALGVLALGAGIWLLHRIVRIAIASLARDLAQPRAQGLLAVAVAGLAISFAAYQPGVRDTRWFFSLPVTPTLWRQAKLVNAIVANHGQTALPPSPALTGDVAALHGADLVIVFAESYGVTAFDDPVKAKALREPLIDFERAVSASGRGVVSARVRSPTYGGGSWLAHAALLTGIDTSDPGHYDVLLASHRPSLVSLFAANGYRTVGWMPGLQKPWPEGAFYGYDRIAGADSMGYSGLEFGYWRIPDQASMALLAEQELPPVDASAGQRRQPRLVVFPTLATHVPFRPLAPYADDWSRMTRPDAYTPAQLHEALAAPVSMSNGGAAYVDALRYQFHWLGAYLAHHAPRHMTMIVLGDHQPLAAVSGQGASWDVPIHVISDDTAILLHLRRHGFVTGMTPPSGVLSRMSELTPLLVEVFSDKNN